MHLPKRDMQKAYAATRRQRASACCLQRRPANVYKRRPANVYKPGAGGTTVLSATASRIRYEGQGLAQNTCQARERMPIRQNACQALLGATLPQYPLPAMVPSYISLEMFAVACCAPSPPPTLSIQCFRKAVPEAVFQAAKWTAWKPASREYATTLMDHGRSGASRPLGASRATCGRPGEPPNKDALGKPLSLRCCVLQPVSGTRRQVCLLVSSDLEGRRPWISQAPCVEDLELGTPLAESLATVRMMTAQVPSVPASDFRGERPGSKICIHSDIGFNLPAVRFGFRFPDAVSRLRTRPTGHCPGLAG